MANSAAAAHGGPNDRWDSKLWQANPLEGTNLARRAWNNEAVHLIEADYNRTSDTHLILHRFLAGPEIRLYLKDESQPSDRQP